MQLTDIVGQPVNVGDAVAVGMSYGQSSVLRLGRVVKIVEKDNSYYHKPTDATYERTKWSITIEWTHNGDNTPNSFWGEIRKSTIKYESGFTYAKLMVLPNDLVEQFPPDITKE